MESLSEEQGDNQNQFERICYRCTRQINRKSITYKHGHFTGKKPYPTLFFTDNKIKEAKISINEKNNTIKGTVEAGSTLL